jgi:dihydroorotase
MFGSDSAPHPTHKKECCGCAAGVFTAPIAIQALTGLFEKNGKLENLQTFLSDNAQRIYNFHPRLKEIVLEKEPFLVPQNYNNIVPMFAGEELEWNIKF